MSAKRKKKPAPQKKMVLNPQKEIYDVDAAPHVFSKDEIAEVIEVEPGVITDATIIAGKNGETKVIVDAEDDVEVIEEYDEDGDIEVEERHIDRIMTSRAVKAFIDFEKQLNAAPNCFDDVNINDGLLSQIAPTGANPRTNHFTLKALLNVSFTSTGLDNIACGDIEEKLIDTYDKTITSISRVKPLNGMNKDIVRSGCVFMSYDSIPQLDATDVVVIRISNLDEFIDKYVSLSVPYVDSYGQLSDGYYKSIIDGRARCNLITRAYVVDMNKLFGDFKPTTSNGLFGMVGDNMIDMTHLKNHVNEEIRPWSNEAIDCFSKNAMANSIFKSLGF